MYVGVCACVCYVCITQLCEHHCTTTTHSVFFHLLLVLVPDTRGVDGLGGAAGVCASNWRVRLVELALASDWFFGRRPSFIFHSLTSFYRP